jgi:hypothetical protein
LSPGTEAAGDFAAVLIGLNQLQMHQPKQTDQGGGDKQADQDLKTKFIHG